MEYSELDASPPPFLHLIEILKHLPRTGWLRTVKHPESVSGHMYRLAFLVLFAPVRLIIILRVTPVDFVIIGRH